MLLVESVGGAMAAKAADHGNISILAVATLGPYCAQSRSSVAARLWKMVTMAFCCRLHVRSIARVWQSQVMNARASDLSSWTGHAHTHPATKHLTLLQVSVPASYLA